MDIYKKFGELATEGIAAALCSIIETKGSTPRKAGSKMIVTAEGITYGSVGGGKLELQGIADALKVIYTNMPSLKARSSNDLFVITTVKEMPTSTTILMIAPQSMISVISPRYVFLALVSILSVATNMSSGLIEINTSPDLQLVDTINIPLTSIYAIPVSASLTDLPLNKFSTPTKFATNSE